MRFFLKRQVNIKIYEIWRLKEIILLHILITKKKTVFYILSI